jgi:pimeloyl-ACP methyl ester carboxylesterase
MPVLEVPGATLNYRTAGDGPPLALVHRSATDLTTWDGVIDELARDHQVIAYDRRGYGQSRHRPVRSHARITRFVLVTAREQRQYFGLSPGPHDARPSTRIRQHLVASR